VLQWVPYALGAFRLFLELFLMGSSSINEPPASQMSPQQLSVLTAADASDDEADDCQRDHKRRELPPEAVSILKAWLLSPEHFEHPYPSPQVIELWSCCFSVLNLKTGPTTTPSFHRYWKEAIEELVYECKETNLEAFDEKKAGGDGTHAGTSHRGCRAV
jgi:hypothetical protein